jgi:FKBP-type peptidyl-prolyl cis-trans isomerase
MGDSAGGTADGTGSRVTRRPTALAVVVGVVLLLGLGSAVALVVVARDDGDADPTAIGSRVDDDRSSSSSTSTTTTSRPATPTTAPPPVGPPPLDAVPIPGADTDPLYSGRTLVHHGTGTVPAQVGDTVAFRFVGRLPSGDVFVDSWATDPGPVSFTLGDGQLRAGLDEQLRGLVAGDRAEIVLGSEKAFGSAGDRVGSVPPDSPVAYLVDVADVVAAP